MSLKDKARDLMGRLRLGQKDITELWQKFEAGKRHNDKRGLKNNCEVAYRFYEGDQWYGLDVDEPNRMANQNFITRNIDQKVASICMNEMAVVFEGDDDRVCSLITETVNDVMKKINLNCAGWDAMEAAEITGNGYVFFPCGDICVSGAKIRRHKTPWQLIDSPCIFFGDEQTDDIQGQPYIIIYERKNVEEARRIAKANGLDEEEIDKIRRDEEDDLLITTEENRDEVQAGCGKCSSIIYMEKREDGALMVARSTKRVIYEPLHPLCGSNGVGERALVAMDMYPVAGITVGKKKNSSRGRGEVLPAVANQIECNKNIVRMVSTSKNISFPKLAYARDMIDNPEALSETGAMIAVDGQNALNDVSKAVGYIQPANISSDVMTLNNILKDGTSELMNSGQAVLGGIDPEKASGSAIITIRDQAEIPLNKPKSAFKQLYKDCGMILFHYLIAYNPAGINVEGDASADALQLTQEDLQQADISINVEATSIAPYSIFARDSSLEKLMQAQVISFEEYVESLDENSTVPKKALKNILEKRKTAALAQQAQAVVDDVVAQDEEQKLLAGMAEQRVGQVLAEEQTPQGGLEGELAGIMGGGEANE